MGQLFAKKKPVSRITEQDKAVLKLKQTRDKLKQYQKKIVVNQAKERILAKQLLDQGRKDKALRLLKKKKFQDSLLDKTDVQLDNLDKLVQDIEFAQVEIQVVEGLKGGNEALDALHQIMSLDDVEKIMGDTEDAIAYQNEIDDLMAGGAGVEQPDEDELLAELGELLGDEAEQELPDVPVSDMDLPVAPTHELEKTKSRDEPRTLVAS